MQGGIDVEEQVEKLKDAAGALPDNWLQWVIVALVVIIGLYIAYKVLLSGKRGRPQQVPDLAINVMALGDQGPPAGAPVLELYSMPVRLAAVVLATAGRVRELPPDEDLADTYEAILPGLARVVQTHRPLVRRWPPQMSAKGFAHGVFQHCRLPGEGGKGSPWCTVAGLFKIEGQPLMAALILRSSQPSSHGQQVIESPEGWLGCVRVRGG
ncbi:MAG: hypothetical protein RBS80_16505 [Thermoguttaceae bacterium]|jgi:hypothetical protein|nr:hypothetical protein [Thermoguttaceae bacterium]